MYCTTKIYRKTALNRYSRPEEDHEPRERGLPCSGFHDYSRKTGVVSHEPRELSLWYSRLYPDSRSVRVKAGKRDR
ncbi:MAG: hypothetical protein LBL20_04410 [Treponema sp.]|nr:hypothetical protein [Treponema sp.]